MAQGRRGLVSREEPLGDEGLQIRRYLMAEGIGADALESESPRQPGNPVLKRMTRLDSYLDCTTYLAQSLPESMSQIIPQGSPGILDYLPPWLAGLLADLGTSYHTLHSPVR
jgi:hypothetical protein